MNEHNSIAHTQTHTQTHTHTQIHTQTHTQTHKHTRRHTHKHTNTHTHLGSLAGTRRSNEKSVELGGHGWCWCCCFRLLERESLVWRKRATTKGKKKKTPLEKQKRQRGPEFRNTFSTLPHLLVLESTAFVLWCRLQFPPQSAFFFSSFPFLLTQIRARHGLWPKQR